MQSSLPQRQDHLRVRYRSLLESAWGRPASGSEDEPSPRPEAPGKATGVIAPVRLPSVVRRAG
jgi:hypothetical protein